jgi:hypothetical protein
MTDQLCQPKNFRKMFREIMAIRTSQMEQITKTTINVLCFIVAYFLRIIYCIEGTRSLFSYFPTGRFIND